MRVNTRYIHSIRCTSSNGCTSSGVYVPCVYILHQRLGLVVFQILKNCVLQFVSRLPLSCLFVCLLACLPASAREEGQACQLGLWTVTSAFRHPTSKLCRHWSLLVTSLQGHSFSSASVHRNLPHKSHAVSAPVNCVKSLTSN